MNRYQRMRASNPTFVLAASPETLASEANNIDLRGDQVPVRPLPSVSNSHSATRERPKAIRWKGVCEAILLDWLSTGENYERWRSLSWNARRTSKPAIKGDSKTKIGEEIAAIIQAKGFPAMTGKKVLNKIEDLERRTLLHPDTLQIRRNALNNYIENGSSSADMGLIDDYEFDESAEEAASEQAEMDANHIELEEGPSSVLSGSSADGGLVVNSHNQWQPERFKRPYEEEINIDDVSDWKRRYHHLKTELTQHQQERNFISRRLDLDHQMRMKELEVRKAEAEARKEEAANMRIFMQYLMNQAPSTSQESEP